MTSDKAISQYEAAPDITSLRVEPGQEGTLKVVWDDAPRREDDRIEYEVQHYVVREFDRLVLVNHLQTIKNAVVFSVEQGRPCVAKVRAINTYGTVGDWAVLNVPARGRN